MNNATHTLRFTDDELAVLQDVFGYLPSDERVTRFRRWGCSEAIYAKVTRIRARGRKAAILKTAREETSCR